MMMMMMFWVSRRVDSSSGKKIIVLSPENCGRGFDFLNLVKLIKVFKKYGRRESLRILKLFAEDSACGTQNDVFFPQTKYCLVWFYAKE